MQLYMQTFLVHLEMDYRTAVVSLIQAFQASFRFFLAEICCITLRFGRLEAV